MRAGLLRESLTIQTATVVSDGQGGQTITWTNGDTVRGQVAPRSGGEFMQAGVLHNALRATVRLRYHPTVAITTRLYRQPSGPSYEVMEVLNADLRNRELLVEVVEVDA